MAIADALDRYFAAWNAHDGDGVVAALTDDGTYEDPTTGGPLRGDALAANVNGLVGGFPDLHFELGTVAPTSATSAAAEWRMQGTNTGSMPIGPATGGTVDLPGADFLTYDPDADRISTVVGYFDTGLMLTQLGLQVHLSPADMDPFLKFGLGIRVDTGRDTIPGAFTVTWIEVEPEDAGALSDATEKIVVELLDNPGYLGTCFATVGKRNWTFSAWESVEVAESALSRGAHDQAMRLARTGGIGRNARGLTSIWKPERLNNYVLPAQAGSFDLSELEGQWL
ncbi:MAG: nuclear transport factor 2 family protein [Acidimicrobiia bacterium]